ncbi:MAG: SLC13 family permease [Candidatus Neomarinimicrobiota bacterium]|jgi:sodium-dependent dicarboxylate transporter 2/3/5|nr:SLC13 family permease [Candidatus Neomarinimicrobiota bacterium]|tara:strand:+ start:2513 stop:4003 length:1491 start_codon:yes stop_codon:yes gene_type:complete
MSFRHKLGLVLGISVFIIVLILPIPENMNPKAMKALAVSSMMAIFWVTEAISIIATAFIPIALFPLLGILNADHIAASYGHHIVLLIIGAFFVSKAIESNNLHKRIALGTIRFIGTSRRQIILSFMIASAFLSMWTTNNSTTLMMLPIALAIIQRDSLQEKDLFGSALVLSIAYAASIGGTGTLIGTPPNLLFVSTLNSIFPNSPDFVFTDWLKIGIPFVLLFLPIAWLFIIKYFAIDGGLSDSHKVIEKEYQELGPMSIAEKRVLIICILYALGFVFRRKMDLGFISIIGWSDFLGIQQYVKDSTVAFFAALLLFAIPADSVKNNKIKKKLLNWDDAKTVPWGIAFLIAGGLAIASAFKESDLILWIGHNLNLEGISIFFVVLFVVAGMVFLTEINSNTASTAIFLPVLAGLSQAGGFHPYLLMIPATIAASCAFMLPSGTGPNAIVLSSGNISIPVMAKCGFWLNLIAIGVIVILLYFIILPLLGVGSEVPDWM